MTNGNPKKKRVLSILPVNWKTAKEILKDLEKTGWKWKGTIGGNRVTTDAGKVRGFSYYLSSLAEVEAKYQKHRVKVFRKRL